jgi:hypothetical protein
MLVDRGKEWGNYKMEVVIKKVNKKKPWSNLFIY